ncbi:MAG: hypothetical protein J6Q56_00810 [Clostridia bacterium]|nr:hypothetical protein [Clostridia bacterium]
MEQEKLLNEETIPSEEADAPEVSEGADVVEADKGQDGGGNMEGAEEGFTIRYRHKDISLTNEEARRLAQVGKHFEDNLKESFEKLGVKAQERGLSTREFIDSLGVSSEKTDQDRIAEEFSALCKNFPEYRSIEELPEEVLKGALNGGELEKELLRFRYDEERKINMARAAEEKNRMQSVGAVKSDDGFVGADDAFKRGLWA